MKGARHLPSGPSAKSTAFSKIAPSLGIAAAVLAMALASFAFSISNVELPSDGLESAFRLHSSNGDLVESRALRGRPYAVFFGFTQCAGVCAPTMMTMAGFLTELGKEAAGFQVFFITLDPERDTREILNEFLSSFGPGIAGLTGSPEEIARAAKSFQAYYRKAPLEGGGYTIDHAALVYLVGREGRVVDLLSIDEPRDSALRKMKALLRAQTSAPIVRDANDASFAMNSLRQDAAQP